MPSIGTKSFIMSFVGLEKREDAKDLLTEDIHNLVKTAPENKKQVLQSGFN